MTQISTLLKNELDDLENLITEDKMNDEELEFQEEENALLSLLAISLIFSVVIPFLIILSPSLISDGPFLITIVLLAIIGPGMFISSQDLRFVLNGLIACTTILHGLVVQ